jgi:hypothetical protein
MMMSEDKHIAYCIMARVYNGGKQGYKKLAIYK